MTDKQTTENPWEKWPILGHETTGISFAPGLETVPVPTLITSPARSGMSIPMGVSALSNDSKSGVVMTENEVTERVEGCKALLVEALRQFVDSTAYIYVAMPDEISEPPWVQRMRMIADSADSMADELENPMQHSTTFFEDE